MADLELLQTNPAKKFLAVLLVLMIEGSSETIKENWVTLQYSKF